MSFIRKANKLCCRINCNSATGTVFQFPNKNSDRYETWLVNSGLSKDLDRDVQRYLCEKHFSK